MQSYPRLKKTFMILRIGENRINRALSAITIRASLHEMPVILFLEKNNLLLLAFLMAAQYPVELLNHSWSKEFIIRTTN